MAQTLFEKKCGACHETQKALTRRTYQDWKLGVAHRHGKPENRLSDKEAREIFMHLIVHVEPELKEVILKQSTFNLANWRFLLVYISGALAFLLFLGTFAVGKFKALRMRYFKYHRRLAHVAVLLASFHVIYGFYLLWFR